jgi:hypothetical protein
MRNFVPYIILIFICWVIMSGNLPAYLQLIAKSGWQNVSPSDLFKNITGGGSSSSSGGGGSLGSLTSLAGGGIGSSGGGWESYLGTAATVAALL